MSRLDDAVPLPSNQADFEVALMRAFAGKYSDVGSIILQQFEVANVIDRHGSRVGCFTHFSVSDKCMRIPAGAERVLDGPVIRMRGIKLPNAQNTGFGTAGSLLFLEQGKISMLECFAYGESWPEDYYEFEVLPAEGNRQSP
jgi:hypothetical protein